MHTYYEQIYHSNLKNHLARYTGSCIWNFVLKIESVSGYHNHRFSYEPAFWLLDGCWYF